MIEKYMDALWSPVIASLLIVGGLYQVFRPESTLEWNRRFAPTRSWEVLVKSGFATSRTYVVAGYIAILAGVVGWVLFIVRPDVLP